MRIIRRGQYLFLVHIVKWFPVLVQFIIFFSILDYWLLGSRYSGWVYPIMGHSLLFDALLLALSCILKFCLWHKLLVTSLIYNALVEWLLVNFDLGEQAAVIAVWQTAISLMFIVCAVMAKMEHVCTYDK